MDHREELDELAAQYQNEELSATPAKVEYTNMPCSLRITNLAKGHKEEWDSQIGENACNLCDGAELTHPCEPPSLVHWRNEIRERFGLYDLMLTIQNVQVKMLKANNRLPLAKLDIYSQDKAVYTTEQDVADIFDTPGATKAVIEIEFIHFPEDLETLPFTHPQLAIVKGKDVGAHKEETNDNDVSLHATSADQPSFVHDEEEGMGASQVATGNANPDPSSDTSDDPALLSSHGAPSNADPEQPNDTSGDAVPEAFEEPTGDNLYLAGFPEMPKLSQEAIDVINQYNIGDELSPEQQKISDDMMPYMFPGPNWHHSYELDIIRRQQFLVVEEEGAEEEWEDVSDEAEEEKSGGGPEGGSTEGQPGSQAK